MDPKHLDLVAGGDVLSRRIYESVGAAGFCEAGELDRTRPLQVLLQEGMRDHPLRVWMFPYSAYALPSFDPRVKDHILPQSPFDRLDLTRSAMTESVGGYLASGDDVVYDLLAWLAPFVGNRVGTDMADLARFFRSYTEPSDRRVAGRMYPTHVAPRHCWHNTPHPAGLGGDLPPGLVAAIEVRIKALGVAAGTVGDWVAYLHRRMAIMFAMPAERWAYTLLHLAEYNGGEMPGLVEPGLSTRDPADGESGRYTHTHAVVQEAILHAMYWVMSRAPIEVPTAAATEAWEPPPEERTPPERALGSTKLCECGDRLADKRDLVRFLQGEHVPCDTGVSSESEESEDHEPAAASPAVAMLPLTEVDPVAQTSWPGYTGPRGRL